MKWIYIAILLMLGCLYMSYNLGYDVGKRSIILNPKGTINDLVKDFRSLNINK